MVQINGYTLVEGEIIAKLKKQLQNISLIKVSYILNNSQFADRGIFYGSLPYKHSFINLD